MAHDLHRDPLPMIAASAFARPQASNGALGAVAVSVPAGGVERGVLPIATVNAEPLGLVAQSASVAGRSCAVHDQGIVKCVAGASVGVGADVGFASTNGALGPIAAASGVLKYSVGKSTSAAAAGEIFSVYVRPKVLSGVA